jgi:hypothetical protein
LNHDQFQTSGDMIPSAGPAAATFEVVDTYWGYVIRSADRSRVGLQAAQFISWSIGLAAAVASLGLWVIPGSGESGSDLGMRLGLSVVLAGMAVLLLWYASRGADVEVQIDTLKGEVREVIRNRAGKPTLIGRYGFDAIGGAFLDRRYGKAGEAALKLRYRNTNTLVTVAHGAVAQIEALKDRLGRELLLAPQSRRPALPDPLPMNRAAA